MAKIRQVALATAITAALSAGGVAMSTTSANAAYPRGYVTDGILRASTTTSSAQLARIKNQYVEIICYTSGQSANGTAKWFKAQYYSSVGYLNASVVSSQPSVGHC